MASHSNHTIPQGKFLTIAVNLLHRAFVESTRTDAKRVYRTLHAGSSVLLATLRMEDESTVKFSLSLDHSEYPGKLNYGAFRASVGTLIANIAEALKQETDVRAFNPEGQPDSMIFGVTGVTVDAGQPAVMVLGADMAGGNAGVQLQLMYLDPAQFAQQQEAASAGGQ